MEKCMANFGSVLNLHLQMSSISAYLDQEGIQG